VSILASGALQGQEAADFDIDRAYQVDSTVYVPFRVALVTDQMAYHHVAQGEIAGEPWMVSF
jgi:hypothetical protein